LKILQVAPIPPEIGGQTQRGAASHAWSLALNLSHIGHNLNLFTDNLHPEIGYDKYNGIYKL